MRIIYRYFLCLGGLWPCASALAQPSGYFSREIANTAGVNGAVSTVVQWDPDGPGPESAWNVLFGDFTRAGRVISNGVVGWDGLQWRSMASFPAAADGVNRSVFAGCQWNSFLAAIAPAPFGADVNTRAVVAVYDGVDWATIPPPPSGQVVSLQTVGPYLVIVGRFPGATPSSTFAEAQWDGAVWTLHAPVPGYGPFSAVFINDTLYATITSTIGADNFVVNAWTADALQWSQLSTDPLENVTIGAPALLSVEGNLVAWSPNLRAMDSVEAEGFAIWTGGHWAALPPVPSTLAGWHYPLFVAANSDQLLALGNRSSTTTYKFECYRWNDQQWSAVPSPLKAGAGGAGFLAAHRDSFLIAASSTQLGVSPVRLSEAGWHGLGEGLDGGITASGRAAGEILFGKMTIGPQAARAEVIARSVGGFRQLGASFASTEGPALISSIVEYQQRPVAGGTFNSCESGSCGPVSTYADGHWMPLGNNLSGEIGRLCAAEGTVYAFGRLAVNGGTPTYQVMRLNGSAWEVYGPPFVRTVRPSDLKVFDVVNGTIVVGTLTSGSGTSALYALREGAWSPVPGTTNIYSVSGAAHRNGKLLVCTTTQGSGGPRFYEYDGLNLLPFNYAPLESSPLSLSRAEGCCIIAGRYVNRLNDNGILQPIGTAPWPPSLVESDRYETVLVQTNAYGFQYVSSLSLACSSADIAGPGAAPGPDGRLSSDDLIHFIDNFFSRSWRADVGSLGGIGGSDGAWDNNDFVVFIDLFFAGC